jgi:hypothetical protein
MSGMKTGYVLLSLDTELGWGHYDLDNLRRAKISKDGLRERSNIERLLQLFDNFNIVGTWAVVGHLFYDKCEDCQVCPILDWEGQYSSFSQIYQTSHRQWYGADVIDLIRKSKVQQEIGFHGYTHRVFDPADMTADEAHLEASEWLRVASRFGVAPGAVVFPRNRIGHKQVLKNLGYTCFRGDEIAPAAQIVKHVPKLAPYLAPPVVYKPIKDPSGLVNLPASRWIGPDHSLENASLFAPLYSLRLKQIIHGLEAAAQQKKVIHIWLHPYEFQTDDDFTRFEVLLSAVAELVDQDAIRSVGMAELAAAYSFPVAPVQ